VVPERKPSAKSPASTTWYQATVEACRAFARAGTRFAMSMGGTRWDDPDDEQMPDTPRVVVAQTSVPPSARANVDALLARARSELSDRMLRDRRR
jgi:hypothetical protein